MLPAEASFPTDLRLCARLTGQASFRGQGGSLRPDRSSGSGGGQSPTSRRSGNYRVNCASRRVPARFQLETKAQHRETDKILKILTIQENL